MINSKIGDEVVVQTILEGIAEQPGPPPLRRTIAAQAGDGPDNLLTSDLIRRAGS